MTSFQRRLQDYLGDVDELSSLSTLLDNHATDPLGASKTDTTTEWAEQKNDLMQLFADSTDQSYAKALRMLAKIVDTLEMYAPTLKGLLEVHAFTCEKLESLVFDRSIAEVHVATAAYLYGQAMAMSTLTSEAVALAVENMILQGSAQSAKLALCVLLGVDKSNGHLFENQLPILLRQIQVAAFNGDDKTIVREALLSAMRVYSPTEKATSCQLILQSVHTLLVASLQLCRQDHMSCEGVTWTCFIIEHTPMLLRLDLRQQYPETCDALRIFEILSARFSECTASSQKAMCTALPVLTTWETTDFVAGTQVTDIVNFMMGLDDTMTVGAFDGLGQTASVILDRFEPYLEDVSARVLNTLQHNPTPQTQTACQKLLGRLLASLGPISMSTMIEYLHFSPSILLKDVALLEMIATLLPSLSKRIVQIMMEVIDSLIIDKECTYDHETVLQAINVFPLDDIHLAARAQDLVIWSLDEEKGKGVVIAALQLATNVAIAVPRIMRKLTFKGAQLLLADDAHIVHFALNVLSNPLLASALDERACSMILLALHQSIEPSIQIVAAKLLTHLTTANRAIVQPLAWSHIRQSLSLMDFLHTVDPNRAVIEACIISNLLYVLPTSPPALPPSLHKKYVGPVKELILSGLQRPNEGQTLSLIFQGLANLAKFEGWSAVQQSELAMDLLEMTSEVPKDSQHAALNAISRLLSVPTEGLDVYDLLISVHATFGGRGSKLDADLKALVSAIYGHLGTVERNPVISRDSRAAINRETSVYTPKTVLLSQVAEVRDKSGAASQVHINWLVTKSLIAALSPAHRATEERALVLEVMTSLGILQPSGIPALIPDLPSLIFRELRFALDPKDGHREATPVPAAILFLASALHTSPLWLQQYWGDAAEVMAEAIREGEGLAVLRGLDVVLDAVTV